LSLWQQRILRYFSTNKQHSTCILTGSYTCATTNTSSSIHSFIGRMFRNRNGISILCITRGVYRNITTSLLYTLKRTSIYNQILDYWKGGCSKGLYGYSITIFKHTHVQLTCRYSSIGSMRFSINLHGAHPTNTFTAIMVKSNR